MQLRTTIKPGDIGAVIRLHGILYAQEHQLDQTFEGYVAAGMGEFIKAYNPATDCLWLAEKDDEIVGSIAIVGQPDRTAQLRWFLVHPDARGGLGRELLRAAIQFCREHAFKSVFLWTVSELHVAAHLYTQAGFVKTEQKTHHIWGKERTEERYNLVL